MISTSMRVNGRAFRTSKSTVFAPTQRPQCSRENSVMRQDWKRRRVASILSSQELREWNVFEVAVSSGIREREWARNLLCSGYNLFDIVCTWLLGVRPKRDRWASSISTRLETRPSARLVLYLPPSYLIYLGRQSLQRLNPNPSTIPTGLRPLQPHVMEGLQHAENYLEHVGSCHHAVHTSVFSLSNCPKGQDTGRTKLYSSWLGPASCDELLSGRSWKLSVNVNNCFGLIYCAAIQTVTDHRAYPGATLQLRGPQPWLKSVSIRVAARSIRIRKRLAPTIRVPQSFTKAKRVSGSASDNCQSCICQAVPIPWTRNGIYDVHSLFQDNHIRTTYSSLYVVFYHDGSLVSHETDVIVWRMEVLQASSLDLRGVHGHRAVHHGKAQHDRPPTTDREEARTKCSRCTGTSTNSRRGRGANFARRETLDASHHNATDTTGPPHRNARPSNARSGYGRRRSRPRDTRWADLPAEDLRGDL